MHLRREVAVEPGDGDSYDGEETSSAVLQLRWLFLDVDIWRMIVDLGRCFFSGWIAGGVLRSHKSALTAEMLRDGIINYAV